MERVREIALFGEAAFTDNRMFEFNVQRAWIEWKPPALICASDQGIFTHREVDQ